MGVSENALQIYFVRNHVPYFLQFCYYPITMNGANPVPNGSPRAAQLGTYWIYPSVRSLRWMFQCGTIQRAYKPYGRLQHSSGVNILCSGSNGPPTDFNGSFSNPNHELDLSNAPSPVLLAFCFRPDIQVQFHQGKIMLRDVLDTYPSSGPSRAIGQMTKIYPTHHAEADSFL